MRATLAGLDAIDWASVHPNHGSGLEIPRLLSDWADGVGFEGLPRNQTTSYRLVDMLLHQGTRFGGAGEALPFLLELAAADETPKRAELVGFAAGIGAPVEPPLEKVSFDRELYAQLSDDALWSHECAQVVDGFAAMCAHDGRAAWRVQLARVSDLVDDLDDDVRIAAIVALAPEGTVSVEHEPRLRRALACETDVGWHAALALGLRADHVPLDRESLRQLDLVLNDHVLERRACAAFALAQSGWTSDRMTEVLVEVEQRFSEFSALRCRFPQALTGMLARSLTKNRA